MSTNKAYQPHTSAVGSEKPFSTQTTPDPAATSCYCGVVVATFEGFEAQESSRTNFLDDELSEYDGGAYYRRCQVHESDSQSTWLIDSLGDLVRLRATLTPAGIEFMNELRRESDKKNPYIPELDRVKGQIANIDEFLSWCNHAREKEEEWNQEDSASRASKGIAIPYPDWLRKYSRENQRVMETRRDELFNEKLEIQQKIVNWRYQLQPQGGNKP